MMRPISMNPVKSMGFLMYRLAPIAAAIRLSCSLSEELRITMGRPVSLPLL